MTLVTAVAGPWRAAFTTSEAICEFEPQEWLHAREPTTLDQLATSLAVCVEVRLHAGGMIPKALLGARLDGSSDGSVTFALGHTGDLLSAGIASCESLLGYKLVLGLPMEFAQGALHGLTRTEAPLPASRLTITSAGYDPVDSSPSIFRHAGQLLRIMCYRLTVGEPCDTDALNDTLKWWLASRS